MKLIVHTTFVFQQASVEYAELNHDTNHQSDPSDHGYHSDPSNHGYHIANDDQPNDNSVSINCADDREWNPEQIPGSTRIFAPVFIQHVHVAQSLCSCFL